MMDSGYIALPLLLLTFLAPAWLAFRYYRTSTTDESKLLAPFSLGLINLCIVKSVSSLEANFPLAFMYAGCSIGIIWQRNRAEQRAEVPETVAAAQPSSPLSRYPRRLPGRPPARLNPSLNK